MSKNTPILVAESDLPSALQTEAILTRASLDFDIACTITEAIECLNEYHYRLVVLSLVGCVNEKFRLPELTKKIVERNIPILIVLESYQDQIQKVGFPNCDYIQKPIVESEFLKKIRRMQRDQSASTKRRVPTLGSTMI